MSLTVNGSAILDIGLKFRPRNTRIERKSRVADGSLVVDVIARKRVFSLTYEDLDGSEYEYWDDLYAAATSFTFTYPLDGETQTCTVWVANVEGQLVCESPERWAGVSITLEEI
jgi:hypothetical protein